MSKELLEALNLLEKEKSISKDTLLEAIENSLLHSEIARILEKLIMCMCI